MRNPSLMLTHPEATRERLLALVRKIPGAYIGIKIAALLLILEGQRPGWVAAVLSLTRQSLSIRFKKGKMSQFSTAPHTFTFLDHPLYDDKDRLNFPSGDKALVHGFSDLSRT